MKFSHVMILCHWVQHHMIPMELHMEHDTDASIGTTTDTKSYVIPLNNHPNKGNVMMSLTAQSASCDRKHVTAMCMSISKMSVKCHISYMCKLVHVHMRQLCPYITSYECNAISNLTRKNDIHTFHINGACT